jgi:hypothetical protein
MKRLDTPRNGQRIGTCRSRSSFKLVGGHPRSGRNPDRAGSCRSHGSQRQRFLHPKSGPYLRGPYSVLPAIVAPHETAIDIWHRTGPDYAPFSGRQSVHVSCSPIRSPISFDTGPPVSARRTITLPHWTVTVARSRPSLASTSSSSASRCLGSSLAGLLARHDPARAGIVRVGLAELVLGTTIRDHHPGSPHQAGANVWWCRHR